MKIPEAGVLNKSIQESDTDKYRYKRIWDMCSLFLNNQQHLRWDETNRRFRVRRSRNQFTANKIVNPFRNLQSKLIAAYPSIAIAPSSDSVEDILKAEAAEAAIQYYWDQMQMKRVISKLVRWVLMTGNAGLLTRWNGKKKRVISEVIAPYDLFFEPGATELEESEWVAVRKLVNREELETAYPEHKEAISMAAEGPPPHGLRTWFGMGATDQKPLKNHVEIYDVYFKGGERKVLLNTEYIFETEWPGDAFPIQLVRHTITEGILWGMGVIEPVVDVQIHYNRSRQQVIESTLLMANPPWMIPNSSGVQSGMITGKPGNEVFFDDAGGRAPSPVQMPGLPAYVPQNIAQLESEVGDIMGIHSTTLGKRAIGVHSGAAIENLSAMDMTQLQVTQDNIEEAMIDLCKVVLSTMRAHYTEPRMIRMMDQSGAMIFKQLSQTDISDNPEVRIEAGSLFRDEIQDRERRVLELFKLGLIDNTDALKEISFKTGSSFITKRMRGMAHAQELLIAATQGKMVEVFATDDLESFKRVWGDFIQSETYYTLEQEIQDYIRDVFVSIETFGQPDQDARSALLERTVFPRQERAKEDATKLMASYGAPASAMQAAGEHNEFSSRKAFRQQMDGEASPEGGLPMTPMGGGG